MDGGQGVLHHAPVARMHVHIAAGDQGNAKPPTQCSHPLQPCVIVGAAMQLHGKPQSCPELLAQPAALGGIGFGGGSRILDPYANTRAVLEGLDAGSVAARLDSDVLRRARTEVPLRRDEKPWILAAELAQHVPLLQILRAGQGARNE